MGHKIIGDRFISRGEPAWHRLGLVFDKDEEITVSEAVARVAGDVVVRAHPMVVHYDDGSAEPLLLNEGHRAIVADAMKDQTSPKVLGVVTDRNWTPTSYVELAKGLDDLGKKHLVETAGFMDDSNGVVFFSLRGREWDVKGDPMKDYFTANLSLTPGVGHSIMHAPVRTVCFNTNQLAKSKATMRLSIPHTPDAKQRLALAGSVLARLEDAHQMAEEAFNHFASRQLAVEDIAKVFHAAFPDPKLPPMLRMLEAASKGAAESAILSQSFGRGFQEKMDGQRESWEKAVERASALRHAALDSFESFNPNHLRGTGWAAFNAVTEIADWREGGKQADASTLWGTRAQEKSRAFVEVAKITEYSMN